MGGAAGPTVGSCAGGVEQWLKPFKAGIESGLPRKMARWVTPDDLEGSVASGLPEVLPITHGAKHQIAVVTKVFGVHLDHGTADTSEFEFGMATRMGRGTRYRRIPEPSK